MQAVILVGIQGSGKSEFCRERFYKTHIRLNLDMLKTRNRENLLLEACLSAKQPFVIDNTNPTRNERAHYISRAKDAGFQVIGYYFRSSPGECLPRNDAREGKARVPVPALLGTYKRLELPRQDEGFDELYYVRISDTGEFVVEVFTDEI